MTTTPLDPKAIRDAIELRLHQMNTYGESPAHVADHLLSLLKVAPVAARPLSSITDEEAREALLVAFNEKRNSFSSMSLNISLEAEEEMAVVSAVTWDRTLLTLTIYFDGSLSVRGEYDDESVFAPIYYPFKMQEYLNKIGISLT